MEKARAIYDECQKLQSLVQHNLLPLRISISVQSLVQSMGIKFMHGYQTSEGSDMLFTLFGDIRTCGIIKLL